MKQYILLLLIPLLLASCSSEIEPIVELNTSCDLIVFPDGLYINNSGDTEINSTSFKVNAKWLNVVDDKLVEQTEDYQVAFETNILPKQVIKFSDLKACIPESRYEKSNIYLCEISLIEPTCTAPEEFAVAFSYFEGKKEETLSNPDVSEYHEVYRSLKPQFE
jgi:hypothetical protein